VLDSRAASTVSAFIFNANCRRQDTIVRHRYDRQQSVLMPVQDALAHQLQVPRPHSAGQLASAGSLFATMLPVLPATLAPRACAALTTAMRSAGDHASSDPATSLEVLFVCEHCMRALCEAFGCAAPRSILPEGACASIEEDYGAAGPITGTNARRLLATGKTQKEAGARDALAPLQEGRRIDRHVFVKEPSGLADFVACFWTCHAHMISMTQSLGHVMVSCHGDAKVLVVHWPMTCCLHAGT
jgi:hypothetical protein